jgi:ketosteroid isomerase-like protein
MVYHRAPEPRVLEERPLETETSRQLVRDYYAALRSGDPGALAKVLADDLEWMPPRSAPHEERPYRGRERVLAAMRESGARAFDLSTARTETRKVVADGDTVVVLQSLRCKARNGRDYSNEYVWVFTCAGGKIARIEEHVDTLRFQRIVIENAPA